MTTRFKGLARIVIRGFDATVYVPAWARAIVRTIPGRRWSTEDNCWTIPASEVHNLTRLLEQEGYIVRVIEPGKPKPPLVLPGQKGTDQR